MLLPVFGMPVPDCAGNVEIADAHVVRVEKNGALILSDGRAVLLEGIRLASADHAGSALGDAALDAVRTLAMAGPLTLTSTPPKEDRYDRIRVQAFGDNWLQLELLRRGLARVQIAPDRNECAPDFYEAEQSARAAGRGLWAAAGYAVREPDNVANSGNFQVVEGRVLSVRSRDGRTVLDFGRNFYVVVETQDRKAFRDLDPPLERLTGHHIRVRGVVEQVEGHSQIALSDPQQIEMLP